MNSAHSRCGTFRDTSRSNRWRKAGPLHEADASTRHHVTYLLQTLHPVLIKQQKHCLYANPTEENTRTLKSLTRRIQSKYNFVFAAIKS